MNTCPVKMYTFFKLFFLIFSNEINYILYIIGQLVIPNSLPCNTSLNWWCLLPLEVKDVRMGK